MKQLKMRSVQIWHEVHLVNSLFSKHGIRRVSNTYFYANHSMNVEEPLVVV